MATDAERDLFEEKVLAMVGRDASQVKAPEVAGFLAARGRYYSGGLMVVGRATNGWNGQFRPSELSAPAAVAKYAAKTMVIRTRVQPLPHHAWVSGPPLGVHTFSVSIHSFLPIPDPRGAR